MVTINKIYTRFGDQGQTHLVGGKVTEKYSLRVRSYGDIDELNSHLGMIRTLVLNDPDLTNIIKKLQNDLFDIGSLLATASDSTWEGMKHIKQSHIDYLEQNIDKITGQLPVLKSFVLPGGTVLNSHFHIARTVCRRAERTVWELNKSEPVDAFILKYINRLSDLLFALARQESVKAGVPEYLWENNS